VANSPIHPALLASLDQELTSAVDGLLCRAAEHDGKDLIEANVDLMNWLMASPLSRAQLAASAAALALRLHRSQAGRD
jgi:hypothetical protein